MGYIFHSVLEFIRRAGPNPVASFKLLSLCVYVSFSVIHRIFMNFGELRCTVLEDIYGFADLLPEKL